MPSYWFHTLYPRCRRANLRQKRSELFRFKREMDVLLLFVLVILDANGSFYVRNAQNCLNLVEKWSKVIFRYNLLSYLSRLISLKVSYGHGFIIKYSHVLLHRLRSNQLNTEVRLLKICHFYRLFVIKTAVNS